MSPQLQLADATSANCMNAVRKAAEFMLHRQHQSGFWWEDLTADTTLESDYILFQLWLHRVENGKWNPPNRDVIDRAVSSILARQLADGGFNIYPGGPAENSACVKAYFSLKVAGLPADDPVMVRLRNTILDLGGIQAANSYTKLNLSFFGLYKREYVPSVPPEMMLLGNFIYEMSSWSRAIVIPLSIISAANPQCPVPDGFTLDELYKEGVNRDFRPAEKFFSFKNFFYTADTWLKVYEKSPLKNLPRPMSIQRCEQWMLEHLSNSDGLAAIYPPMMYSVMAMDVLGYAKDDPRRAEALRHFDDLMVDDDAKGFYFQPCFSVVWDTAIAAYALAEVSSAPGSDVLHEHVDEALSKSADWLLTKECRRKGDWAVKRPNLEPSGWYFEFANDHYPDIDDTAMVLIGMDRAKASNRTSQEACARRAVNWLLGMQGRDGGWAAFDVDNNWHFLSDVPFADHNAMLDPSCPDITGRVLDALCRYGIGAQHGAVRRGIDYLIQSQEPDGSWYGRWGVAYIYGTFLALKGLRAAGVSDREVYMLRAAEWLRSIQNADGGWGESCQSYDKHQFVNGHSTASQTAWAVMGLLASGDVLSESVRLGVEYLIRTQRNDGSWDEELATGTGFPKVFYLTYHMYRNAFPMMALAMYLNRGADDR
jgi:squalene-hopene/tetraprenyl-beta-curcumene cyclase